MHKSMSANIQPKPCELTVTHLFLNNGCHATHPEHSFVQHCRVGPRSLLVLLLLSCMRAWELLIH